MSTSQKPNVIVYRDELLAGSETFIAAQVAALREHRGILVGTRPVKGLTVPGDAMFLANGRFGRWSTKLLGINRRKMNALANLRPALVHAHFLVDAVTAMEISTQLAVPLIVTVHGYDATSSDECFSRGRINERVYVRRKEKLMKAATKFLCVSEFLKRSIIAKGFPEEKIEVHYTGIDTHQFTPHPEVVREPIVLFVARLVQKKGCECLMDAMAHVQASVPEASLVVIGDGPLRAKLESKTAPAARRARFLGHQNSATVREWMNRASVFCVPSVTAQSGDTEGFGMVFAEAQCMGLPVVSTFSGGIPEAVHNGKTGLLVRENDSRALSSSIIQLLTNRDLWKKFSENGRARVLEQFDIKVQNRRLEEIYAELIQQKQSAYFTTRGLGQQHVEMESLHVANTRIF